MVIVSLFTRPISRFFSDFFFFFLDTDNLCITTLVFAFFFSLMCSSIGRAIARFARGPGFEPRHSRSMFFCYIGDPDVMSRLCYDHIPPHPSAQTTSCYDRTTNFRMHCMFLSHSVLHQGDLCSGFHLHTICVVNTLSHSYRV